MNTTVLRTLMAAVLVGAAVVMVIRFIRGRVPAEEKGFFYDVSAARLFVGARNAVPPIRGVDGPEEDAFRAVVVAPPGRTGDRSAWQVAYLERCSPELKQKMEAAQASGEALAMSRLETQNHRFVRTLSDPQWHPMSVPEADAILSSWTRPGPDGVTPVLCSPP